MEPLAQNSTKKIFLNQFLPPIKTMFLFATLVCRQKIINRYQISIIEHDIYEFCATEIHRWLAIKKINKSIVRIPDTKYTCTNIPSDALPIQLCSDHSFLVNHHHQPRISTTVQNRNFTEYIKSIPGWISLLIYCYTVHLFSDSLFYHICNRFELLISTVPS